MLFHLFLTFWLLAAAVTFVSFYAAHNRGLVSMAPDVEHLVNQPLGILAMMVLFLLLGPLPIAAIRIKQRKAGEPHFAIDMSSHS